MRRNHLLTATAITVISLISLPAHAQDSSNVSSRIGKLEEEIRLLKRQQEVAEEINQSKAEKQGSVEIGKKGLAITSPDKEFSLKIRGYTQIDGRLFADDESNTGKDDILARRVRPVIEGTAFKDFSYRLMADFAGSSTRVFDAHIDYKYADPLNIRVGKFKPPVGLERLQSATDLLFVERGHPTNLAPTRDFGVQFSGDLIPETLEYQVGVFNGNADLGNTDSDDDDKKDLVARVFAHPFRQSDAVALRGLGVGIAGSVGDREGSPAKRFLGITAHRGSRLSLSTAVVLPPPIRPLPMVNTAASTRRLTTITTISAYSVNMPFLRRTSRAAPRLTRSTTQRGRWQPRMC